MKKDVDESAESTSPQPRIGKIKLYFFWCLLVILSLVAMELVSFTIIKFTRERGAYRDRAGQVLSPYHPYLGYVQAPNTTFEISKGLSKKMSIATDENGYSITPSFSYPDPDLLIIVTGGSTIFGVGSSDNSTTVPSILEQLINQRLDVRAEVVNLALRGGQSFQEMLLVDRFFAEKKADLVLAISGRNEVYHAIEDPTVEGAFLTRHVWDNAVVLVHRAEKGEFMLINLQSGLRSWSYTYDLLYRWIKKRLKKNGKPESSVAQPEPNLRREASTSTEKRARITATHYGAIEQISEMNGATFVMILQPTLFNKKTWTEEELFSIKRKKWGDEFIEKLKQREHEFYDAFRRAEKPFQFIDLSHIFAEYNETLYIDQCHYNDLAAEQLAEKVFESIEPLLQEIKGR
jgi:hypothetical protein